MQQICGKCFYRKFLRRRQVEKILKKQRLAFKTATYFVHTDIWIQNVVYIRKKRNNIQTNRGVKE